MDIYDKDIRSMLVDNLKIRKEFVNDPSTVMVHELDICSGIVRADLAVFNGKTHGFEIKSEKDTLDRLTLQVEHYSKVFDKTTLVLCEKHLDKALKIIPEYWGVYYVDKGKRSFKIKRYRPAKLNRNVDYHSLIELLWKEELLELLEVNGITKGLKSKTKKTLRNLVINKIDNQIIKAYTMDTIKNRVNWRAVPILQLDGDLHL